MSEEAVAEFKSRQRETWSMGNFADIAVFTTPVAGHLVRFAGVAQGHKVLDVGTGTGVVAITARGRGAQVTGLDLTPSLLEHARQNAAVADMDDVVWQEGDAEALPFRDETFDVVLSQFGHMFAPRPEVALSEMLRVLKPGGTLAFATWPPEQLIGRLFALNARYVPPPGGFAPPMQWGDVSIVQQRLSNKVGDIIFQRGIMSIPALSPQHVRLLQEAKTGPFVRMVQALGKEPARLTAWRNEVDGLVNGYLYDNVVHQEYLLTRAIKI